MANIWIIIGGVTAIIGALALIARGFKGSMEKMTSAAFQKGQHSERHEKLDGDIGKAHRRLDGVEGEVSDLKADKEANTEVHKAIIKDLEQLSERTEKMGVATNTRLDKILELLVSQK